MTRVKISDLQTKEEVLARHWEIMASHQDRFHGLNAQIEGLQKRLKDHRKAKALANKRADVAVSAMKDMLNKFEATQ